MKSKIAAIVVLFMMIGTGCGQTAGNNAYHQEETQEQTNTTGFVKADAGRYDSSDLAVVVSKNEENNKITFSNIASGRQYTLSYDGATAIFDQYEQPLSMAQIMPGEIVDVTFMKRPKRLNSLRTSADAWIFTDLKKFEIAQNSRSMKVLDQNHKLDEECVIFSGDKEIDVSELNVRDTLTVKGIGNTVYSISVDKGHGYLRLSNDTYFIGGWIEVGQEVIQPVTEDMLLTVPEGTYKILLTNKGIEGNKEVTILRDGEVELDVGDIQPKEKKFGQIAFTTVPADASLYIDGEKVDTSQIIKMEYGIHQMIAKAAGYDTITQYLKVGKEMAKIDIELEESDTEEKKEESDSNEAASNPVVQDPVYGNGSNGTTSSNNTVVSPTSGYKVYIDAPKDAEVYVDGMYTGIAPTGFSKVQGSHIITLRRTGYQTKSYTIELDSERKDITYSFSDLLKEGQ